MTITGSFIGSNPMFDCALIHKFEYFWSVTVPLSASKFEFESPIVHTIKNTFDIAWKFIYSINESGSSFTAKLLSIDNQEVDVFLNCNLINILNKDYKICVIEDKHLKYQSSVNCWETFIKDSNIYAEYNAKLIKLLKTPWPASMRSSFKDLPLKFQIEFKVMETKPHVKPKLELSKNLRTFRSEDKAYSDVTFIVNGKEFQAHKAILVARSPVFATMLTIDMQEKRSNKIYVDDVEPDVFEQFLDFVYSGRMDCEANCCDTWAELLIIAEKYGLEDLKTLCVDMTTSLSSVEDMTKIFAIANFMNDEILKRAAVDFVVGQEGSVKESEVYKKLIEAHPFLLNEMKISK